MVRVMTDEDARKLVAELRAFKEAFHMAGNEVVTIERTGRQLLERIRIDDLIERLERPTAKQMSLFDPKNRL
jgi:hypothetical protein